MRNAETAAGAAGADTAYDGRCRRLEGRGLKEPPLRQLKGQGAVTVRGELHTKDAQPAAAAARKKKDVRFATSLYYACRPC